MSNKLIWIYIWIFFIFLYSTISIYEYKYWNYTENEKIALKKKLDVTRLPRILYDENTVDKLYNSISLEKEFNNINK